MVSDGQQCEGGEMEAGGEALVVIVTVEEG